jgi:dCMP deaminase
VVDNIEGGGVVGNRLKMEYGISQVDYDAILDRQGGVCSICKQDAGGDLVVDHDHVTGKVRGILCQACNRSLGMLREDTRRMRSAISYLDANSGSRSWDRYFMDIASLVSTRSKDLSTRVGAIIVSERTILSTGYNGFPRGVNDNRVDRFERPEKYLWTVHAEENAIFNAARIGSKVDGSSIYVTPLFPCGDCAKSIISAGIREVVVDVIQENPRWDDSAMKLFSASRVVVRGVE